ncbi:AfsR/SARP family transcriptional regulator [Streptomyces tauricus]|uniref:AfsR/SARP family transcriptional regulator n=1 Tax=Streptomyces tauricus TaxID=68274 RepID=UPI0022430ACE|nr:BTAD domain-containing putative transcriptional regulator [Streptomyces tauricus]MCW8103513.1 BTAD domain-containing putative transcriptional regulator [Streptomyces tauricus]
MGVGLGVGLRFEVLGPVRAWWGSGEIQLGSPQQRSVLAALVLAEGSAVLSGELLDAVWGVRAPDSAVSVLRTYVHRLRRVLEPARDAAGSVIRSVGDGYRLAVVPGQCDVGVFRRLLATAESARRAGNAEDAAKFSREALSLWQGPALAGVRGEYAQGRRQRLEELRLSAQATCSAAELDLGAHTEVAAEMAGLVAGHPLDERFRELLMLALYRSGRQAAALENYRQARHLLADELGVDPGAALQSMYQRILRADPALLLSPSQVRPAWTSASTPPPSPAGPAGPVSLAQPDRPSVSCPSRAQPSVSAEGTGEGSVVPAQLPAGLPVFVGREAELAEVAGLSSGATVVVSAIAGTAGVGKTAFAVHWAHRIAGSFPDGQLYVNLRGFDPSGRPIPPEQALRTLLESLGADPKSLPQDPDALAARYRSLLTGKRVLLLLDNARDAAQVRPLLPGAPGSLAIVTSRNRLAGLVAVDGAHPLNLDVLSQPEARALLARRLGHHRITAEPQAVEEIIHRCAGLPLALAVTAAHAATRPTFPLSAIAAELRESADRLSVFQDAAGDTAADIRAVFSWSYQALTPDAARLFRLLSLHPGPDITAPAAASLAALPRTVIRQLLSELIQAHLLNEHTPGRYTTHDLLRAYAAELTRSTEPAQYVQDTRHRILDHYLHTAHEAAAMTGERALISVAPAGEGVRAEEFAGDTDKATAWFAAEQAVLLAAVEQAAEHHHDIHAWQLSWAMANHLHWRGLWREHEAVHRTAMRSARRLGDQTAQAHVSHGFAVAAMARGRVDEARVHAERTVELFTEAGGIRARAESCRTLAEVAEQQNDLETALAAAQQSLALFRAFGGQNGEDSRDWRATAAALNKVGWCHIQLGQHQQALDHCRQALVLCQELNCSTGAAETWGSIGYAHHHLGQYEQAVVAYHNAVAHSRQGDFCWMIAGILIRLGDTHLSAGRPNAARKAWTEALEIEEQLGSGTADTGSLRGKLLRLDESSASLH